MKIMSRIKSAAEFTGRDLKKPGAESLLQVRPKNHFTGQRLSMTSTSLKLDNLLTQHVASVYGSKNRRKLAFTMLDRPAQPCKASMKWRN